MTRILLVDDETDLREVLGDLLIGEGFDVVAAADGEAALQELERTRVDLIVADIVMPRLDGWGLVRQVRSDSRFHDVPFIFLTARGQAADARQGRELGADDYLAKPFEPADLLTMVRSRLRRRDETVSRFRDQVARLEELNRIKDEFVALTSHELARPLTAIRGFAELLLRSAGESSQREFLELIRQESAAMGLLADDLMQLCRLEQGQPLDLEPVAPAELIQGALRPFYVPPLSHRFELLLPADLPTVAAEPTLLGRALANVVTNACKYSRPHSRVQVQAEVVGGRLQVAVTDEGIGMSCEDLQRVGEPFFRIRRAETRGIPGTGLGLALVQRIVRAHGGELRIDSRLGQGTTVTLQVPLKLAGARQPSTVGRSSDRY